MKYPNTNIKYEADLLAEQEYENLKYSGWYTLESIVHFLVNQGLWTYELDNQLEKMDKQLEDMKVDLYKNFLNPKGSERIRKDIARFHKRYNKLWQTRHSFDYLTIEGFCTEIKNQFLLTHSIYDENDEPAFLQNRNYSLIKSMSDFLARKAILIHEYREIARSNQWHQYWNNSNSRLFDNAVIEWTDEQRTLVSLSKMYDNAREHPDSPSDEVFKDDDAFDGWAISERRKNEKERKKNRTESMLPGKLKDANEIFVMANSKEEASNIYDLNDYQSAAIIKERNVVISKSKDNIKEQDLPDVQRDIMIERNQMRKQRK